MKGYKFVTADVADLVARGSVRLTPAEIFRRTEDKPGGRGDPNELTNRSMIRGGEEIVSSDHPAFGDDMFVAIVGGKRVPFGDVSFIGESFAVIHDALLYCLSLEDTPEIRKRMSEDFNAGAAFEITDVDEFAEILSAHPELSFRQLRKGAVEYRESRTAESMADLVPVDSLQKDAQYSWQKEFRLIWGADVLQKPIDLNVPRLGVLLKRLEW